MSNRINHDARNKARKMMENGYEDIVTGEISDGMGKARSAVFEAKSTSRSAEIVTRKVKRATGVKKLSPGSPEWIEIQERYGATGSPKSTPQTISPPSLKPANTVPTKKTSANTGESKLSLSERREASRLFRQVGKKKAHKAKPQKRSTIVPEQPNGIVEAIPAPSKKVQAPRSAATTLSLPAAPPSPNSRRAKLAAYIQSAFPSDKTRNS